MRMTRAIVLGGGMVGSVIARDLTADPGWQVTVADGKSYYIGVEKLQED